MRAGDAVIDVFGHLRDRAAWLVGIGRHERGGNGCARLDRVGRTRRPIGRVEHAVVTAALAGQERAALANVARVVPLRRARRAGVEGNAGRARRFRFGLRRIRLRGRRRQASDARSSAPAAYSAGRCSPRNNRHRHRAGADRRRYRRVARSHCIGRVADCTGCGASLAHRFALLREAVQEREADERPMTSAPAIKTLRDSRLGRGVGARMLVAGGMCGFGRGPGSGGASGSALALIAARSEPGGLPAVRG